MLTTYFSRPFLPPLPASSKILVRPMKQFVTRSVLFLAALAVVWGYVARIDAAVIEIDITAEVETIDDPGKILNPTVQVGDIITGTYMNLSH